MYLLPFQQRPVGIDRIEILDRGGCLGGDDLAVVHPDVGETLDRSPSVLGPAPLGDGTDQFAEDFLALAADDDIDPGGFRKNLLVHEGGVDAAKHPDRIGYHLLGDLKHPLRLVDRRRNGGEPTTSGLSSLSRAARSSSERSFVMASMK
jgi:hypothetical protein